MGEGIIIYGSRYGSSKRYGNWLAKETGFPLYSYDKTPDLSDFSTIVYIGSLYAGGLYGFSRIAGKLPREGIRFFLITVGIADPKEPENEENIRTALKGQVPEKLREKTQLFFLRGAIDFEHLSLVHKGMMKIMHSHLKKVPVRERSAEDRDFLEVYGKKVDFCDPKSLEPILEKLRETVNF